MEFDLKDLPTIIGSYIQKRPADISNRRRKVLHATNDTQDVFEYANPVTIGIELLLKLCQLYPDYLSQIKPVNELEGLCVDELYKKLHVLKAEYEFVEIDEIDDECEGEGNTNGDDLLDDDGNAIENESLSTEFVPVAMKAEILEKISGYWGKYPFKWIQRHGGGKLRYQYYKARWEEQVQNGGTKYEKFHAIDAEVWEKFQEARQALHSVHGFDIKRWAIQAARKYPATPSFKFTASDTWIHGFKAKHKISSRKINKLVKRTHLAEETEYAEEIENFRRDAQELVGRLGAENVINWDQSGCQYEVVAQRTLTHRGEPWTVCSARSPHNRVTHSYTIQYSISASGSVLDEVFLCLQETSSRLGPIVEESLPPCPNVLLTCSKSGKLTTSLIEYFLDKQMVPMVQKSAKPTGFVIDHWAGQLNSGSYSCRFGVNGTPQCELLKVPKNCTPLCQPCDTVFYRQVKYFLRRITEYCQLTEVDSNAEPIHSRRNVILIHSIIHYQLSAKIFQPMVRYAWYKAGILTEKEPFLNVKQACFQFQEAKCEMTECERETFVRCARCRLHICFNCFYFDYHSPMNGCVEVSPSSLGVQDSQVSCSSMEEE